MKLAQKRVKLKMGFSWHFISYIIVNAFLVFLYFFTGSGYFWPIWSILGWGIGLAFHGSAVYIELSQGIWSGKVEEEYKRLKDSTGVGSGDYLNKDKRSN